VRVAKQAFEQAEREYEPWCDAALKKMLDSCGCDSVEAARAGKEPPRSLEDRYREQCRKKRAKINELESAWLEAERQLEEGSQRGIAQMCERLTKENGELQDELILLQRENARLREENRWLLRTREEEDAACKRVDLEHTLEWAEIYLRGEQPGAVEESVGEEWDEALAARAQAEMIAASKARCQSEQGRMMRAMGRC